jgi:hypothetical protein
MEQPIPDELNDIEVAVTLPEESKLFEEAGRDRLANDTTLEVAIEAHRAVNAEVRKRERLIWDRLLERLGLTEGDGRAYRVTKKADGAHAVFLLSKRAKARHWSRLDRFE